MCCSLIYAFIGFFLYVSSSEIELVMLAFGDDALTNCSLARAHIEILNVMFSQACKPHVVPSA